MKDIIKILHDGGYSCVICNNNEIRTFINRGVKDLYDLLHSEADFMKGASVADKAVGKAAACLMILGGINEVYTDRISSPALKILKDNGISVSFGTEVPVILNRDKSDWCPLEKICQNEDSPEKNLAYISSFINNMNTK